MCEISLGVFNVYNKSYHPSNVCLLKYHAGYFTTLFTVTEITPTAPTTTLFCFQPVRGKITQITNSAHLCWAQSTQWCVRSSRKSQILEAPSCHWKKIDQSFSKVDKFIPDLSDQEVCQIKLALTGQITSTHQYREAVGKAGCPFPYQSKEDLFLFMLNDVDLPAVMFNVCNCICLLKDELMENILMINPFSPICHLQVMWWLVNFAKVAQNDAPLKQQWVNSFSTGLGGNSKCKAKWATISSF